MSGTVKNDPDHSSSVKSGLDESSMLRRLWHNLPVIGVMCLSLAIIVGVAVLPLRTWYQQRELAADTQADLTAIQSEVAELQANYELLQTDDEIERLGRDNFDLVFPGEESYRILPAPED